MGITPRGFTQHEHLNSVEIIHMNGRAFDYSLGRFLSVDPFIQGAEHSQSLNPYAYLHNNPLAGTDPTGYCGESLGTRIKDQGACQFSLVGTLANGDTKDLGSYNLNKPGDEMRANNTSLASLFGSGAVGLGVVGPSLQSSGSTAIGAKEGLKPQTTPSALVAVAGGAATAGKVMETVDVTATVSRSARLGQAVAGLRWLIGGMAAAADRNTVNALINGLPSNSCYGNCTCEWVSGNLCMSGSGKQDEMRMASPPLAGASEAATPSGPGDDDDLDADLSFPAGTAQLRHMFRNAEGHVADTPANRQLLLDTASNRANFVGRDPFGNAYFMRTRSDGTQVWVSVRRGGVIQNGGVNRTPKPPPKILGE